MAGDVRVCRNVHHVEKLKKLYNCKSYKVTGIEKGLYCSIFIIKSWSIFEAL
jgi:hypothetical protein